MRYLVLLGLLLMLVACDEAGPATDTSLPPERDRVPITSRAVAAIALDHLPDDTEAREPSAPFDHDPRSAGALLGYGSEQHDVSFVVRVSPPVDEEPCPKLYDGCVEMGGDDGSPMFLRWQELEPEEDPGVVDVVLDRGDERVRIELNGPEILGDPRELDLPVWVEQALEVAQDPRLRLRTSREAVEAGERLDKWDEDEGNPAGYDVVPAHDRDLAAAYLLNQRGADEVTLAEPSPLKESFGAGAIGARLHSDDGVLDILAAEEGPAWLRGDPCESERFAYCDTSWPLVELTGDVRGKVVNNPVYILWRPGPNGEIWVVQQRVDQVVTLRWSDLRVRVPHRASEVHRVIDLSRQGIVANSVLGLTTLKIVTDSDVVTDRWLERRK